MNELICKQNGYRTLSLVEGQQCQSDYPNKLLSGTRYCNTASFDGSSLVKINGAVRIHVFLVRKCKHIMITLQRAHHVVSNHRCTAAKS